MHVAVILPCYLLLVLSFSGCHCFLQSPSQRKAEVIDSCREQSEYQLSRNVVPTHYEITIKPDLNTFAFSGEELIDVKLLQTVREITLHSLDLNISCASFVAPNQRVDKSDEITFNSTAQTVTFAFKDPISVSGGKLHITFNGTLNDKLQGLYRSKYQAVDGMTRYAAVTQFESTDARRAFPCFDEPALKATFGLTLIVDKNLTAISNMPEVKSEPYSSDPQKLRKVSYDKTPKMSTYLLAIIIGAFDFVEGRTKSGKLFRVYTPQGKKEQGKFALDVGIKSFDFFEDYFQVPYSLPKVDMIAIKDFSAGAMENWGAITYREELLLVDPNETSLGQQQSVAKVVAHELAHQWFGNLVTMQWWTHLWLNEGFATFMQVLAIAKLYPEWNMWPTFVSQFFSAALTMDSLHNSHPIEVPVKDPAKDTDSNFDAISYLKGASVLRMIHDMVGPENFRSGLTLYLNRHIYDNTCTEDLWAALEERSNMSVGRVMTTWTKEKGYPLITVMEEQYMNNNSTNLVLKQEKFSANNSVTAAEKFILWQTPIDYITSGTNQPEKYTMKGKYETLSVSTHSMDDWIKLNPGSVGFFRVNYPDKMLGRLVSGIKSKQLKEVDRLELQNDEFALVVAGLKSTAGFLSFLRAYENEDDYFVWSSIDSSIGTINSLLTNTDFKNKFYPYGRQLMSKILQKMGWDPKPGESSSDSLLRTLIIRRMGLFGDQPVVVEAKKRFEGHINGSKQIMPNIRASVYQIAASNMTDKEFDKLFELYSKADSAQERDRIGDAMGYASSPSQINKVLNFALSDAVRLQDATSLMSSVTTTCDGRQLGWDFLKNKLTDIKKRFSEKWMEAYLVTGITSVFASEEKATEVEAFYKNDTSPRVKKAVEKALEKIRLNTNWLERDGKKLKDYLSTFAENAESLTG